MSHGNQDNTPARRGRAHATRELDRALPDVPMARPDVNSALSRDEIETMAQPKTCIRAAPDIVDNVLRVAEQRDRRLEV